MSKGKERRKKEEREGREESRVEGRGGGKAEGVLRWVQEHPSDSIPNTIKGSTVISTAEESLPSSYCFLPSFKAKY